MEDVVLVGPGDGVVAVVAVDGDRLGSWREHVVAGPAPEDDAGGGGCRVGVEEVVAGPAVGGRSTALREVHGVVAHAAGEVGRDQDAAHVHVVVALPGVEDDDPGDALVGLRPVAPLDVHGLGGGGSAHVLDDEALGVVGGVDLQPVGGTAPDVEVEVGSNLLREHGLRAADVELKEGEVREAPGLVDAEEEEVHA